MVTRKIGEIITMDKLIKVLNGVRSGVDYTSHKALIDEGTLDSFDIVSLIAEISDVFGVQVPPEDIVPENFNSAEAIYAMITRLGGAA